MKMPNRRPPIKVSAHFNKLIVKKLEKKKDLTTHKKLLKIHKETDAIKDWPINRTYLEYTQNLEHGVKKHKLGSNFVDFLKKRHLKTKESISVLELGCGEGHFLAGLKKRLNENLIPSKVEGISLVDNTTIENKKHIDRIKSIPVTEHIATKKYDLIVDFYGAIYFSFSNIVNFKKEIILKYAYALKKGGVLIFNVEYMKGNSKLPSVIAHLKKQGFKANFYERDNHSSNQSQYNTMIIERIK